MSVKIILPDWVYRNLRRFGNCALPNICTSMERVSLKRHLTYMIGRTIKLREAKFIVSEDNFTDGNHRNIKYTTYLIAEEK